MSNIYNVQIRSPSGDTEMALKEEVSLDDAKLLRKEFRKDALKGWSYTIINTQPRARKHLEHVVVNGFDRKGSLVDKRLARVKTNQGWYTPRMAKRDMRALGASWFTRENVYEEIPAKSY